MNTSVIMWAAIVKSARGEWLDHSSIRRTRRESRDAYLEGFGEQHHKFMLSCVRFVRVNVTAIQQEIRHAE